jgi:hypothetical protein
MLLLIYSEKYIFMNGEIVDKKTGDTIDLETLIKDLEATRELPGGKKKNSTDNNSTDSNTSKIFPTDTPPTINKVSPPTTTSKLFPDFYSTNKIDFDHD